MEATTFTKLEVAQELPRSSSSVSTTVTSLCEHCTNLTPDDASKLSSKIRGELPGAGKEVKTGLNLSGEKIGQSVDNAVCSNPGS